MKDFIKEFLNGLFNFALYWLVTIILTIIGGAIGWFIIKGGF